MNETNVITLLNNKGMKFTKAADQYSCFDAIDEKHKVIAEMKWRGRFYPDCLLEYKKYQANKEYCEKNNYQFIYCVTMPPALGTGNRKTYVFEPLKMRNIDWTNDRFCRSTQFSGNQTTINKQVTYLPITQSLSVIEH